MVGYFKYITIILQLYYNIFLLIFRILEERRLDGFTDLLVCTCNLYSTRDNVQYAVYRRL